MIGLHVLIQKPSAHFDAVISLIVAFRELELSSMSGPFERQGIHIPEPERAHIVMATPAGSHSSPNRPTAVWFSPEDT